MQLSTNMVDNVANGATFSKEILKQGDGYLIATGATVTAKYTGSFPDGTKFDVSRDRDEFFTFQTGKRALLRGLEDGLCTMERGERAILTIPPKYAYGDKGFPPSIPPDSTLIFDVEVIDWDYEDLSPDGDRSIERVYTTELGSSFTSPHEGALVDVHITGTYEYRVFEDRDVIFFLGQGTEENVPKGVQSALRKFKSGERSTIIMKPGLALNAPCFKNKQPNWQEMVEYEIKLRCFERFGDGDNWSMNEDDKMRHSEMFKEKGNQYFKQNIHIKSIETYQIILEYLVQGDGTPIKNNTRCIKLILSAYLNLSLCYLKTEEYELAKDNALKALEIEPDNEKAHYRCGQAFLKLHDYKKAKHHFELCLSIEPKNKEAKNQLHQCVSEEKKQIEAERKRLMKMFEKFVDLEISFQRDPGNKK